MAARKKEPKTLLEAAKSGNTLETLERLRDKLADSIETCESGRDIAALSRQLSQVLEQIEEVKRNEAGASDKEVPLNAILISVKNRKPRAKD
ncbi:MULTISPECIES: hypothetical protein [Gordonibacter]|uniref:Uncharacterized protein n=1 Tax=Gordonibacter faecis TaxID=3047475 RepID=A0ABT7DQF5_9ACTN|nr:MULTISPECIES: hypothetical protein [unclassified Gordonibacter]MDJ1651637.1 hypothetical protein [Gordonibacter sp. KGMB12511]HIW77059.1 hypothetical protein [Candidatus Gordonibacter avicola]